MSDRPRFFPRRARSPDSDVREFETFEANVLEAAAEADYVPEVLTTPGREDESPEGLPVWGASSGPEVEVSPLDQIEALREEAEERLEEARAHARGAAEKGESIVREAQDRAEEIVEQANHGREEIEAEAYAAGFAKGEEAGAALADQKVGSVVRSLAAVMEAVGEEKGRLLDESREEMVKLAFMIALKVIQREIEQDEEVVLDVARAAVDRAKRSARLTLFVSPQDFKFIEGHLARFEQLVEEGVHLSVEADEGVGRGGCRLVGDAGEVDARVESMLGKLKDRIWGGD